MPLNVVYVWYITTVPGTVKQGSRRATISFDVEIQPTVNPFISCRAPLPELFEHTESRTDPLLLATGRMACDGPMTAAAAAPTR